MRVDFCTIAECCNFIVVVGKERLLSSNAKLEVNDQSSAGTQERQKSPERSRVFGAVIPHYHLLRSFTFWCRPKNIHPNHLNRFRNPVLPNSPAMLSRGTPTIKLISPPYDTHPFQYVKLSSSDDPIFPVLNARSIDIP